jgi:hypothetical protein
MDDLKTLRKDPEGQGGYVLLLVLVTCIALFISLGGILNLSLVNLSSAKRSMFDSGAQNVAETGVDVAMYQLNATNGAYTGTTSCPVSGTAGAVQAFSDTVKGKGTYQTCVTAGSIAHEYIIYAVGKVYKTASSSNPVATRKIKVVVEGTATSTTYDVQTGPGGLIMSNSASVMGTNVSIGGFITMSNTAKIGSTTQPVSALSVANDRCPTGSSPGATYPQVCATGVDPNPITINNTAHIYGNVTANNQTNHYASAITNSGVVSESGATPPTLPGYDRPSQVSAVTNNLTGAAASCSGNGTTVTWPANVKITGDVTASNSCHILVSGNAWVTGNVNLSNSTDIKPAAATASAPAIMVDGSSGLITSNTASIGSNASGVGLEFITFYSTNSCTTATTVAAYCDTLTGNSLYNSQGIQTISLGNQGSAPGAILFAKYTEAILSNGGAIGAVEAQTLNLSNSTTITVSGATVTSSIYSFAVSYYEFQ